MNEVKGSSGGGRFDNFDNLKLFLIFCVIMGHMASRYLGESGTVARIQYWIYLFHMPAFIYVSGLFSKRTVDGGKWNKAVPYILLYIFMETAHYALMGVLWGFENRKLDFLHEDGIPWFALAMFWWYAAAILVKKVHPVYVMAASVLIAMASGYSGADGSFLAMRRTVTFFPFFYLGYLTDPDRLMKKLSGLSTKIAAAVVLAASLVVSFRFFGKVKGWRVLFRAVKAYEEIGSGSMGVEWGFLWRAGAYVISMALTLSLIALMPSARTFVTKLGRRTLPVYVFHSGAISVIHYVIPSLEKRVAESHTAIWCIALSMIVLLITSLPVFDRITRVIIAPKMRE